MMVFACAILSKWSAVCGILSPRAILVQIAKRETSDYHHHYKSSHSAPRRTRVVKLSIVAFGNRFGTRKETSLKVQKPYS